MSGLLVQMAAASRARARLAAAREPLAALRARVAELPPPPALALGDSFELIAEYKRGSPALGRIAGSEDQLSTRVRAYARAGVAAVSVLTEPQRFEGRLEDLAEAAALLAPLGVPAMRKDFLVDPYQLYEARAAGAGGILLIARLLSAAQLSEMLDCARSLGLFTLIEAFDAGDVARMAAVLRESPVRVDAAPVLVGVNSRDLATLEILPYRFRELAPLLPAGVPHVAESGISTPDECAEIARTGYAAALVGGSLMRERNPIPAIRAMLAAGRMARSAA